MKPFVSFLAGATLGCVAGCCLDCRPVSSANPPAIMRDTIVMRDTLRLSIPAPSETRAEVRYVIVRDTIRLPAEQRVYADSSFRAVVSGIDPRLDSLTLYTPVRTVPVTRTRPAPPRSPWGRALMHI
ncbi:MAG: hypothetical protein K2H87_02755 [Duncaniella sp.]|nr:hypothetical protein [Duncaniella sp.]